MLPKQDFPFLPSINNIRFLVSLLKSFESETLTETKNIKEGWEKEDRFYRKVLDPPRHL